MTETLRSPAQLLALVPYLLGFRPERSLVLLWFTGSHLALTVRADKEMADHPHALRGMMQTCVARSEADGLVVAAFHDDPQVAFDAVVAATQCSPVPVLEACLSDGTQWLSLTVDEHGELMTEPEPLDMAVSEAMVAMVADGRAPLASRDELAALVAGPGPDHALEERAADAMERLLDGTDEVQRVAAMHLRLAAALASEEIDVDACLELAALLQVPAARDVVWGKLSTANAEAMVRTWRQVVAICPEPLAAGPLCALGLSAWQVGDGATLSVCYERAVQLSPGWGPCGLLEDILCRAVPPSAWEGMCSAVA